ncbi:SsrA-binding protein SmpB [Blochmannia endosymbiont of Camponotus (Colobopsis) obliquus]|uniref:SsrA-binding protein SmpB n=1 Tax=Blochmannia endosymbiont of Camponotus (Colobopsis) obliquus TaxID=1505597 RepID=UPI00061A7297|nr:SsrA-binding protein SmpB [Blochmannia endosymbiont of Camponotus (Colobopsis) obliquus]AKC60696.1 ssrA-binding protein [Blochmannia endosymbiont of Camponotus (Colobopsis) obliquus]
MINNKKKTHTQYITNNIIQNKKAQYEYYIEQEIEAGLSLLGWEIKSARSKNININNSFIFFKNTEAYLMGAYFKTPKTCQFFSNLEHQSTRNRKILLKKKELCILFNKIKRKGYTAIPLNLYWKNTWIKLKIGIAKGKKQHDQRSNIKNREWNMNKLRIIKRNNR